MEKLREVPKNSPMKFSEQRLEAWRAWLAHAWPRKSDGRVFLYSEYDKFTFVYLDTPPVELVYASLDTLHTQTVFLSKCYMPVDNKLIGGIVKVMSEKVSVNLTDTDIGPPRFQRTLLNLPIELQPPALVANSAPDVSAIDWELYDAIMREEINHFGGEAAVRHFLANRWPLRSCGQTALFSIYDSFCFLRTDSIPVITLVRVGGIHRDQRATEHYVMVKNRIVNTAVGALADKLRYPLPDDGYLHSKKLRQSRLILEKMS